MENDPGRFLSSHHARSAVPRASTPALWFAAGLILITAIAAGARLYQLGRPSFWGDELRTVRACGVNIPEDQARTRIISQIATAVGLWASGVDLQGLETERPETWRAHGVNEWNARIGSAVVGIFTVPILVLASRRMIGSGAALFAGLLLALAPWHILWSQAARFYTLQFLFYSLCLIFYIRWRQDRVRRLLVVAAAGLFLAFLAQPTSLIALAVIGADIGIGLLRREITLGRREATVLGATAAACLGLLSFYLLDHPDSWWRFVGFTGEQRYQHPLTLLPGTLYMVQLPVAAIALLTALWLYRRDRSLATMLALAAIAPLLVLSVWSAWNFVGLRYTLITLWWWLVLAGIGLIALYRGIEAVHGKALAIAPAVAVLIALTVPLYAYYEDAFGYRGRWREAFDYARAHMQEDEEIATTNNQRIVAQYYLGTDRVRDMKWTLPEMRQEFSKPTWLVFQAETSVRGLAQEWTRENAQLHAVFDLRVPQPIEMVQVYRYVPTRDGTIEVAAKKDE